MQNTLTYSTSNKTNVLSAYQGYRLQNMIQNASMCNWNGFSIGPYQNTVTSGQTLRMSDDSTATYSGTIVNCGKTGLITFVEDVEVLLITSFYLPYGANAHVELQCKESGSSDWSSVKTFCATYRNTPSVSAHTHKVTVSSSTYTSTSTSPSVDIGVSGVHTGAYFMNGLAANSYRFVLVNEDNVSCSVSTTKYGIQFVKFGQ